VVVCDSKAKPVLRAIIVSVDCGDLLELTLPYNRHHYKEVMIVTTPSDDRTIACAAANDAHCYQTTKFYHRGAMFNKFGAMEQALETFGRHGWMCIQDADVAWPKQINWQFPEIDSILAGIRYLGIDNAISAPELPMPMSPNCLYTPLRRMCEGLRFDAVPPELEGSTPTCSVPKEAYWRQYPLHPEQVEWAGYTQIFHADSEFCHETPWHEVNWKHAGGPDSFFQARWPAYLKHRPPFECLHIGPAGVNWCGRTSNYLDGTKDPESDERRRILQQMMNQRRASRSFDSEKF
jgi:hypothetical protein